MIVGISIVRDNRLVLEVTLRHLLAHGVDRFLMIDHRSVDGTKEILARLGAETGKFDVEHERGPHFWQDRWFNKLIARAAELPRPEGEPLWIMPFDADEIIIPKTKATLREELRAAGDAVLYAKRFAHATLERRGRIPLGRGNPKVVFTWHPGCALGGHGAHRVAHHPGPVLHGRIEIRERQFVSAKHFIKKTRQHIASAHPGHQPAGYWGRRGMSDQELIAAYQQWRAVASEVLDPIPLRR
jgi:hypothetical protein